ncbi:hypothetical protein [Kaarinaea lacus]
MVAQQTQSAQRLIYRLPKQVGLNSRVLATCSSSFINTTVLLLLAFLFSASYINDAKADSLLLAQHEKLKAALAQSVFGAPIVLDSETSKHHAQGDVYAELQTPISDVQRMLSQPEQWCELAILHINIKACTFQTRPSKQKLTFYVGRKYYQEPSQAFPLTYRFEQLENTLDNTLDNTRDNNSNHLYVKLSAEDGPFGTHDYHISVEAVPLDKQRSFIHFQYRYHFGFLARMAMNTYLATFGRHKVGFTVEGKDIEGKPAYVKGVQGVTERNVIRYIYAIQSLLDAGKLTGKEKQQQAFNNWYTLISKHPRQLVEYTREEYLDRKQQELKNQLTLQKEIQNSLEKE